MRIGRAILIPAILTLSVAGSTLAATATPAAAGPHVSNVHVLAQGNLPGPDVYYHS
jgi:hypothetical protein